MFMDSLSVLQGSICKSSYGGLQCELEWGRYSIIEVIWAVLPRQMVFFNPTANSSSPAAWAWTVVAISTKLWICQRKTESLKSGKIIALPELKELHGFNLAEHMK